MLACFLHECHQTAQAEPFRGQGWTSSSLVRPVSYDEADSDTSLPFFAPLLAQLEEVSRLGGAQSKGWATEAIAGVRDLAHAATGQAVEVRVACDRLDRSVREAYMLASMGMPEHEADLLRRAGYAVQRRISICRTLLPIDSQVIPSSSSVDPIVKVNPKRLENAVRAVDALLATDPAGQTWRKFLMLDELANLPPLSDLDTDPQLMAVARDSYSQKGPGGVTQRRAVVRKALASASDIWLNEQQRAFLQRNELKELGAALRAEAAGPISGQEILRLVEQYETLGLPSTARQLADQTMWLSLVKSQERVALRQELTNHYRNANFRIEVAEVLMDRFIPAQTPELAPVRDTVLGRPVRGESLTETKVGIQLIPSEDRLMLALDVTGEGRRVDLVHQWSGDVPQSLVFMVPRPKADGDHHLGHQDHADRGARSP